MAKYSFYFVYFMPVILGFALSAAVRFLDVGGMENVVGVISWVAGCFLNIYWVRWLSRKGAFARLAERLGLNLVEFRDFGA